MDPNRLQIALLRKFAHLYDSGVSLAEALDLARSEVSGEVHDVVGEVLDDIYRGTGFADALGARPHCFSPAVVAVIRAGELRGELSAAARSAADGLDDGLLEGAAPDAAAGEALLLAAGDARFLHVADGQARVRTDQGLTALEEPVLPGAVASLLDRADDCGAFVWQDRLIRIASSAGHVAIELSGVPAEEPEVARAWRQNVGGLLVVHGDRRADYDAVLRSILRGFDPATTLRLAVGLPVPEAVAAPDTEAALRLDPDVVVVRRPWPIDISLLLAARVPAVVATNDPEQFDHVECAKCAIR
jgi:hypothetical protein